MAMTELAEQDAVGREDAHRQLRPIVGEAVDLGEVGVGDGQRDRGEQDCRQRRRGGQPEQRQDDSQNDPQPAWQALRFTRSRASSGVALGAGFGIAHGMSCMALAL
jgi:hypothetical protein